MEELNHVGEALFGTIPCDGCRHHQRCKTEALICHDFNYWVNTGKIRHSFNRNPVKIRESKLA